MAKPLNLNVHSVLTSRFCDTTIYILFYFTVKDDDLDTVSNVYVGTQENPELIWNDESRERLCSIVKDMANEYVSFSLFVYFMLLQLSFVQFYSHLDDILHQYSWSPQKKDCGRSDTRADLGLQTPPTHYNNYA